MSSTAVIIHLLGAAALLVLGLAILRKGMDQAFGSRMRIFLGVGTSNRGKAFGVGFLTTLVLQSSTATAIMTSSFVEQGLILLPMSLAVMLGADMGTSIVSQLVSLKITILSPTFILLGVALPKFLKNRRGEGLGRSFVGLGLMLLALKLMGEATDPIRESTIIQTLFGMLGDVPFAAVVASGLMAAATASSLAVVLFVLSLYQAGAIDPLLAIYFVAGANLGGALPPFFVVGHNHAARQVIAGNLTMRLIGTLLVTWIVPLFPDEIRSFASSWGFGARFPVDVHVAFNVALGVLFMPFLNPLSTLIVKLLPIPADAPDSPKYLTDAALITPQTALLAAQRETLRIGDTVERMLENSLQALRNDEEELVYYIRSQDDKVDALQEATKKFIAKLNRTQLSEKDLEFSDLIVNYSINLEHVGDIIEKSLSRIAEKKSEKQIMFSLEGFNEIEIMFMRTIENLHLAQTVFMTRDPKLARQLVESKEEIRRMESDSSTAHFKRYQEKRFETVLSSSLHLDILRDLKRINAHLTSVAYPILTEIGVLRESRLRAEEEPRETATPFVPPSPEPEPLPPPLPDPEPDLPPQDQDAEEEIKEG